MSNNFEDLEKGIQTGYLDSSYHSNKAFQPKLLHNDPVNGKKVLTTLIRSLLQCEEFWFSVAFITTSGVATLLAALVELRDRGIKGRILASQYLNFTQPEALRKLLLLNNIELRIATQSNFHSKGYLFKNGTLYDLVIGSSNLTASALCTNKEWNLNITGTAHSQIIKDAVDLFESEFDNALPVTTDFITEYIQVREKSAPYRAPTLPKPGPPFAAIVKPNKMQTDALRNLSSIRAEGKNKALLVSATGTGKTFLSAFDARNFNSATLLFVVHRANIAEAALKTFRNVFNGEKKMGMYSGSRRDLECDFLFSTIQTLSKPENLHGFSRDQFDYIVIDETHRAGADSYRRILDYFSPRFLLGMSATPERTDGFDIFGLFEHTIAYEIRLHQALEEEMLAPFHYYGITDITVEGKLLSEDSSINLLAAEERVERIAEKATFYGTDSGKVKGLIFCSRVEECELLATRLMRHGLRTKALSGNDSEAARDDAIKLLENNEHPDGLDYILTVDIFNEGIDIPSVNQIIMLRPTQSAIVFVQQLGRGLRKLEGKDYLTVIDFIGNYKNNFLVPIALYGDTSYNKDTIRKLIARGSSVVPGESTINFDRITRERIYEAIDNTNMSLSRDLKKDYELLKFKLGKIPMMMDFIEHGSRDPYLYVSAEKSYYNYIRKVEQNFTAHFSEYQKKLLELFSTEINNTKRVEECVILEFILNGVNPSFTDVQSATSERFGYFTSIDTINSAISNLNFEFFRVNVGNQLVSAREAFKTDVVHLVNNSICASSAFSALLKNELFSQFLLDNIQYSTFAFSKEFEIDKWVDGFVLYRKYSRKDVFRILNWSENPVAQNVGGYLLSADGSNCPIFVNYHKNVQITDTTKYVDEFINNSEFAWMSKSRRTLNSPDVQAIVNYDSGLRLPLFIKRSNDEGVEFYFMGDLTPIADSFQEASMPVTDGNDVSVVKVVFSLEQPVEESIYNYITGS